MSGEASLADRDRAGASRDPCRRDAPVPGDGPCADARRLSSHCSVPEGFDRMAGRPGTTAIPDIGENICVQLFPEVQKRRERHERFISDRGRYGKMPNLFRASLTNGLPN
jgi:hypothetical protein